uniref:Uncharacterized protein n=1 Tax=Rhizophora mucronata TaxID=61149 RepID=A0A2P2N2R0_RHIMU
MYLFFIEKWKFDVRIPCWPIEWCVGPGISAAQMEPRDNDWILGSLSLLPYKGLVK